MHGLRTPRNTIGFDEGLSNGVVRVDRMDAQSLGAVTTTARAVIATIERSVVSVDGGRVLMSPADRPARARADHYEHAAPLGLQRPIRFTSRPPGLGRTSDVRRTFKLIAYSDESGNRTTSKRMIESIMVSRLYRVADRWCALLWGCGP